MGAPPPSQPQPAAVEALHRLRSSIVAATRARAAPGRSWWPSSWRRPGLLLGSVAAALAVGIGVAVVFGGWGGATGIGTAGPERSNPRPSSSSTGPGIEDANADAAAAGTGAGATAGRPPDTGRVAIAVHAAGAVAVPGVYRLPEGSRTADLVAAAGGLAPDADPDRVNLAALLADGVRVYVPHRGEATPPPAVGPDVPGTPAGSGGAGAASPPGPSSTTKPAPIDLNRASEAELEQLPGVGPATAAAIVAYRGAHGAFAAVDDLTRVRGIGPAKLAQLRDRVRV